ncbi:MAG: hypothetical protein ACRD2H_12770 [Terriglobales bacterium]
MWVVGPMHHEARQLRGQWPASLVFAAADGQAESRERELCGQLQAV